jgi:hypothetical protein
MMRQVGRYRKNWMVVRHQRSSEEYLALARGCGKIGLNPIRQKKSS